MKILAIGSLLLSGGTAVAMQNETVREETVNLYNRARYVIQHRIQNRLLEEVKETGFPYPPQAYLDTLTDEQEALVIAQIDQINATYDWANMTDEEILDAFAVIRDDMAALYDELGIDGPNLRERIRQAIERRIHNRLVENGLPYPSETYLESLTEEQQAAFLAVIDTANETYDWANMTREEIKDALISVHEELLVVAEEYGFELPTFQDRFQRDLPIDPDVNPDVEDDSL